MSSKMQAGGGRWPPKKQEVGDEDCGRQEGSAAPKQEVGDELQNTSRRWEMAPKKQEVGDEGSGAVGPSLHGSH